MLLDQDTQVATFVETLLATPIPNIDQRASCTVHLEIQKPLKEEQQEIEQTLSNHTTFLSADPESAKTNNAEEKELKEISRVSPKPDPILMSMTRKARKSFLKNLSELSVNESGVEMSFPTIKATSPEEEFSIKKVASVESVSSSLTSMPSDDCLNTRNTNQNFTWISLFSNNGLKFIFLLKKATNF